MYGTIVEATFENGTKQSHRLDSICRPLRQAGSENLELMMRDVRSLLREMQEAVLRDQIEEISETSRICPDCNRQADHHNGGHLTTTICPLPVRCPPGRRQIDLA
ncbi:hypothetical protein DOO74_07785 [Rhodobacteraceae bacterium AsT-22]|nr:hypothetical protein DOO74_07785 [Rhodobacteraceae bacterium AsT-22]